MKRFDVLIVGAGIVGCAVARECAQAGLRVGIVEAGAPAGAATGAAMGHIVALDGSPAQLALTAYSQTLWQAEVPHLPAAVEYAPRGTLWIAADDEEMEHIRGKLVVYRQAGLAAEVITAGELAELEPNLRQGLAGALRVADDSVVAPAAAAAFFLDEARAAGAELILARVVRAGEGTAVLADGTELAAERIVLAVGAECDLLPALPLFKRKGHLALTAPAPGFVRHQLVELGYLKSAHVTAEDSVAFNVQPRWNGQVLVGSSRQYGSDDPEPEPAVLRRMWARAKEFLPALCAMPPVRVWAGFRAATADKLPILGPAKGLSEDESLWLAVGFEGLGITSAPGAARLLVDGMLGREPGIDPEPYRLERLLNNKENA